MRNIFRFVWRQFFFQHLAGAFILAGLVLWAGATQAKPRSPQPPVPESDVIYYQGFDRFHPVASGDARAAIPGLGTLVESFSGYALDRSGPNVLPFIIPAVNPATGHTNITCNAAGAIRFYYQPYFSSLSVAGGTAQGSIARLADLVAVSKTGTVLIWSLQISADGNLLRLLASGDSGAVEILAAPIAWQANQPHMVAMNFGPQGAALFIDGQIVA